MNKYLFLLLVKTKLMAYYTVYCILYYSRDKSFMEIKKRNCILKWKTFLIIDYLNVLDDLKGKENVQKIKQYSILHKLKS